MSLQLGITEGAGVGCSEPWWSACAARLLQLAHGARLCVGMNLVSMAAKILRRVADMRAGSSGLKRKLEGGAGPSAVQPQDARPRRCHLDPDIAASFHADYCAAESLQLCILLHRAPLASPNGFRLKHRPPPVTHTDLPQ